jgi:hypothetical protein
VVSRKPRTGEDGFRKPEGLGISPGGREIEIIEVKPQGRHQEGVDQLNVMIPKIKDGLSSYYKEKSLSTGSCPSFNPDTVSRRSQAGALVAENPLLFGVIPPSLLYHHGLYLKIGFARTFRHLSYKKRSRDLDRQQQRGI